MAIRSDLDRVADELVEALAIAPTGADPERCERAARDAIDSGSDFLAEVTSRPGFDAEQAVGARNLRDLGEELLRITARRRRERMANRLNGQIRTAVAHGARVKMAWMAR
jgi:hypothetical protein